MVVPGRSWSVFFGPVHELGGAEYGLLGPFPVGSVLRRFRLFWTNSASLQECTFSVSVGSSAQANQQCWAEGVPVLGRSSQQWAKQPYVLFHGGNNAHGWLELPYGARVQSGSRYAIARLTAASEPAVLYAVVTAEVYLEEAGPVAVA
jgi:hypothetical protein